MSDSWSQRRRGTSACARIGLAVPCLLVSAACSSESLPGEGAAGTSLGGTSVGGSSAGSAAVGGAGSSGRGGSENVAGSGTTAGGGAGGTSGGAGSGGAGLGGTDAGAAGAGKGGTAAQGSGGISSGGGAGSGMAGVSGSAGSAMTGGVDAEAMVEALGFGANIGNTLENTSEWETGWGQPLITQQFIQGMASRGIKTVRVPVAWDTYASDGIIDMDKLDRVKEVVSWIDAADMYSIVNIHWDGGWIFNENRANAYRLTDDVKAKFESYWEQIGSGFRDFGHELILEGLNEEARFFVNGDPEGTPDIPPVNELNQIFVDTVRAQGGYNATRALLIAGFNTNIERTCVDAFRVPSDPAGAGKLFLSIHFYDPYPFTLMEQPASWGEPVPTWGTDQERQDLDAAFDDLARCSASKEIPVILGEFGVTRGENVVRESQSRILWMESVIRASFSRGIVPVLWDTGSEIRRSDGSFSSELETALNNAQ